MKKLFCTALLALFTLSGLAQSDKIHCHIEGQLIRKPNCDRLLLLPAGRLPNFVKSDNIIEVKDGKFSYDLYTDEADVYSVIPYDEYLNGGWYAAKIFAEDGNVNLTFIGNAEEAPIVRTDCPLNVELQRVKEEVHRCYTDSLAAVAEKLEEEGRDDMPEYTSLQAQLEEAIRKARLHYIAYAGQQPSLVGLYLLYDYRKEMADCIVSVFSDVYDARYPNHRLADDLRRWIASRSIKVGGKFHDFTAPDINGTEHRLSEKIKGKYALIDLWASWCGSCRRTSKSMIPVYEAYKDKGFTIVGVARETEASNMAQAVEKDKYPWLNLVELNDKAHIWEHYGIANAAGGTFLVDCDGTILAVNPTAEEVKAILTRLTDER